jgi:hypothetical protein
LVAGSNPARGATSRHGGSPGGLAFEEANSRHEPEPDDLKPKIERMSDSNSRAPHRCEAGGIDRGQLVQVGTSKVFSRLLQITMPGA